MTVTQFVVVAVEAVGFVLVALCLGEAVLTRSEQLVVHAIGGSVVDEEPSATRFGVAVLAGIGAASYVGVLLGLAHVFVWPLLLAAGVAAVLLGRKTLRRYFCALKGTVRAERLPVRGGHRDWLSILAASAVALLLLADYAAALAPPTSGDELSYHMPQAQLLVHTHHLTLTLGGHYFYGNIPKLVEVLFAEANAVSGGFSLAHELHLLIAGGFLVFLYGTVRDFYRRRTALLAVLFVLLYDDFVQNATSGLVDAAAVSFEIGSLIAFGSWLERRRPEDIARTALLIALAMSVKYTPAPTLAFLAAGFIVALARSKLSRNSSLRLGGALLGIIGVVGGFWYLKNAIRYGNPFYPLYLGHPGVSAVAYRGLVNDIQQFGPRTLHAFVRVPYHYANVSNILAFLSFYVAPFVLLVGGARKLLATLFAFFILYTAYWFFLATSQTRFLMSAVIVGLILLAVTFSELDALAPRAVMVAAGVASVVVTNPQIIENTHRGTLVSVAEAKLHKEAWRYAIGRESETAYLQPVFGCEASAHEYFKQRHLPGDVIDNWTPWHDAYLTVYDTRTHFRDPPLPYKNWSTLRSVLRRHNLGYLYVRESMKAAFATETDVQQVAYRNLRWAAETTIVHHSHLIWSQDDCRIYRITL